MRGALALVTLAACGRFGFDEVDETSRRQKRITFEAVITPVANFRLPIDLGADADLAPHVGDAYFVDESGVTLPHELESTTAWVLVPRIDSTTVLRVRYGGDPQPDNPAPVWAGMLGVWHLTDQDLQFRDSAGGHHATSTSLPTDVAGVAGRARDFDGVDDLLVIGDPVDGSLDLGTGSFTYSLWVYVTGAKGMFDLAFWKGGSSTFYPGYDIECGADPWSAAISDGVTGAVADFGDPAGLMGRWVYLAAVVDRSAGQLRAYVDGVMTEAVSIALITSLTSSNPARIGDGTLTEPFLGRIDELRIEPAVVSDAELYLRYRVLVSPQTVYTIGPEESW